MSAVTATCPVCPDPGHLVVKPSAVLLDRLRQVAPPCVTCGLGRGDWPVDHRLYLPRSRQCPLCVEADCAEEACWKRTGDEL